MGSGSSKAESKSPPKSNKLPPPKPVANVNKQESKSNEEPAKSDITPTLGKNLHLSGPIAPIPANKINDYDGENNKKTKNKPVTNQNYNATTLQFEDDSDVDDDIDAVLKIPMANEPFRQGPNKEKKNKKEKNDDKENIDNRLISTDHNGDHYNQGQNNVYPQKENDFLPETYAQRLQRQQYKLQQDMLIREKTNIRNLRSWQDEDEDEDENVNYM